MNKFRGGAVLCFVTLLIAGCSTSDRSSEESGSATSMVQQSQSENGTTQIDDSNLCDSMDSALLASSWGDYGVKIANCGSVIADNGDDVFMLTFNDPAEWEDLLLALGDIPVEEAALYSFWRLPLGVLSIGFTIAEEDPNAFDQMLIYFKNQKQTVYDILPRDIAYVINISDSTSKEEYSEILNARIDEVSERVDVINLNE
jgi:hypothetical protein